ncbi:MAG TPA: hypothetical protein VFU44_02790, partial [Candidatus Limnocylindria bacterium]|nr:hypothetical protein [Candidatus Limnocylindria bacterium]
MSSWFDKLLEELQRRQEEADARNEGRPFERRERSERNVTPTNGGSQGRRGGGGPPVARPMMGGDVPWRRYLLIG